MTKLKGLAWRLGRYAGLPGFESQRGNHVRGPLHTHSRTPFHQAARPHLSPPIHIPDAERERQGKVALYLLRLHIRYP